MKRLDELKQKSDVGTEEVGSITASETVINNKRFKDCDSKTGDNNLTNQIAEERAARIFPLNLLSNKFKLRDSNALKGRYCFCMFCF